MKVSNHFLVSILHLAFSLLQARSTGFLADLSILLNITCVFDLHESNSLIHVNVNGYAGPPIKYLAIFSNSLDMQMYVCLPLLSRDCLQKCFAKYFEIPKNQHFLLRDTNMSVCVSGGSKCSFFGNFCERTK